MLERSPALAGSKHAPPGRHCPRRRANTLPGVVPEAEAVGAVEKTLGRRVDVSAWLRVVPRSGEDSAPFGRSPFYAAIVGDELMTFDIRSPGPAVSRLTSWHLADLASRRLSATEVQLSAPLRSTPVTLEAANDRGAQLLELIMRRSRDEPVWRTVLSFVVAPLVAFSVVFFRSRVGEQQSVSYSITLGLLAAAILLAVMAGFFLASRRRRGRLV